MHFALSLLFVQDSRSFEGAPVSPLSTAVAFHHYKSGQHMLIKCFTVLAHDLLGLFSLMCLIKKKKVIKWGTVAATHTLCQVLKTEVLRMRA